MFSPFKYQYNARYLQDQAESALVELQQGSVRTQVSLPKSLLPKELTPGQEFKLNFQSKESAQENEVETMKRLLEELIR